MSYFALKNHKRPVLLQNNFHISKFKQSKFGGKQGNAYFFINATLLK